MNLLWQRADAEKHTVTTVPASEHCYALFHPVANHLGQLSMGSLNPSDRLCGGKHVTHHFWSQEASNPSHVPGSQPLLFRTSWKSSFPGPLPAHSCPALAMRVPPQMLACLTSADPGPAHLLKQQSLKRAITVALHKLTKCIFDDVLLKGISKD